MTDGQTDKHFTNNNRVIFLSMYKILKEIFQLN